MPRVPSESYSGKKRCPICESSFRPQNIGPHIRKCERDKKIAEEERERKRKLHRMVEDCFTRLRRSRPSKLANIRDGDDPHASNPHHLHAPPEMRAEAPQRDLPPPVNMAEDTTASNIRTENYPRGHTGVKIRRSEEHDPHRTSTHHPSSGLREQWRTQWWLYFNSREDYIFAKTIIEAGLSEKDAERLIMIVNRCLDGKGLFTLRNFGEVEAACERRASFISKLASGSSRAATR